MIIFRNIGDTLLASALIDNLAQIYKDAKISVALNANTKEALSGNPNIFKIFEYEREKAKSGSFFGRIGYEVKFAKTVLNKKYDLVFNLTSGDRGAYLAFFSFAKTKVGFQKSAFSEFVFNKKVESKNEHTVESYLRFLEPLGKKPVNKSVSFSCDAAYMAPSRRFVHFHPVSRWLFKTLGDELSAYVIDLIHDELGCDVILTATNDPKELQKVESIISKAKYKPINLSGQLSLAQVGALNKQAVAFVGVDTAIMHISAANDTPTFAFFGPSGAFHWGPWQNGADSCGYTKRSGIQKMGRHMVYQADWECIPCGKDGCDGSKISRCLVELNRESIRCELVGFLRSVNDKYPRA